MSKAKITITGLPNGYKENKDGTANIILRADTSQTFPKGLKYLGESIYNIHIGKKTWKRLSGVITKESKLLIQGEPKACVNSKGIPYVVVNCMDMSIIETKAKESAQEKPKDEKPEKKPVNDVSKSIVENWYKTNEIVKINVKDIALTNETHLKGCMLYVTNLDKVTSDKQKVTVKKTEEGKYTLVMGFKSYIISKVKDFETIDAVVTGLTHNELIQQLGIKGY